MDPHALSHRCVIHVDIDSFFLAVHRRLDPSLNDAKPLVLWQYTALCHSGHGRSSRS